VIAKGHQRKQQILETARRHFFRFGYDRASLTDVAAEVGIRPSALYHYFDDKMSLFTAAFADVWADQIGDIRARCAGVEDPTERVVCFSNGLIRYVDEVLSEHNVPVFVYVEALTRLGHVFSELDQQKRAYVAEQLSAILTRTDSVRAADELVDARNALEHELLREWEQTQADFGELVRRTERLVRVYIAGLRCMDEHNR
jgi:AcrR family transcriptional regulator